MGATNGEDQGWKKKKKGPVWPIGDGRLCAGGPLFTRPWFWYRTFLRVLFVLAPNRESEPVGAACRRGAALLRLGVLPPRSPTAAVAVAVICFRGTAQTPPRPLQKKSRPTGERNQRRREITFHFFSLYFFLLYIVPERPTERNGLPGTRQFAPTQQRCRQRNPCVPGRPARRRSPHGGETGVKKKED